jgi:hypothetical protein
MSSMATTTATFTITDARYVGAKLGTDLRLLNGLYGAPALSRIDLFSEETALLLRDGYLDTVSYGFKDPSTNAWTLRLRYRATAGGQLVNSRPGGLPTAASIAGCAFYSHLTYSAKFALLSASEREAVERALPFQRGEADEPATRSGTTTAGNTYSRNGVGVNRDVFTAF